MSAKIWMEIEAAVKEHRPKLLEYFQKNCRDSESIKNFLNKNFPLEKTEEYPDWDLHLMSRVPAMLKERIHLWKSSNGLKNEDDDE